MPSYQQHLDEARALASIQETKKSQSESKFTGLVSSTDKGPSHTPSAPWRDSASWREHNEWVEESVRLRGE